MQTRSATTGAANGNKFNDVEQQRLPIPEDPNETTFPTTGKCKWTYDVESRVLLADFSQENAEDVQVTLKDEEFLLKMMERDDITCVSDGLAQHLIDLKLYNYENLSKYESIELSSSTIRAFKLSEDGKRYEEQDGKYSMYLKDHSKYIQKWIRAMSGNAERGSPEATFEFRDLEGEDHTIDVLETVLYLIDYDLQTNVQDLYELLSNTFKLSGFLPGGRHCISKTVRGCLF